MDIKNCIKCHKIFDSVSGISICPNCYKDLEVKFKEIRLYIRRNPHASIFEVSQECKMEIGQIKEWIRDERISYSEESKVGLDCEKCGKLIKTGRFCMDCKTEVIKDLKSVYVEHQKMSNDGDKGGNTKMRYLNKKK